MVDNGARILIPGRGFLKPNLSVALVISALAVEQHNLVSSKKILELHPQSSQIPAQAWRLALSRHIVNINLKSSSF